VELNLEFLVQRELFGAEKSEHGTIEFIDQGIAAERTVRIEFGIDF
jgi:hypothetical protein